MKDQKLFQLVRKIVRDKKQYIDHSKTQNFAEIYCSQRLPNKKIKNYRNNIEIKSLIQNFPQFKNYFNKKQQIDTTETVRIRKSCDDSIKNVKRLLEPLNIKQVGSQSNRNINIIKNVNMQLQNQIKKSMLSQIQSQIQFNNQIFNNNSGYNRIYDSLQQCFQAKNNNLGLFQKITILKEKNDKIIPNQLQKDNNNQTSFKIQKTYDNDLSHRISSYLMIALEMQHRSRLKDKINTQTDLNNIIALNKLIISNIANGKYSLQNNNKSKTQRVQNIKNCKDYNKKISSLNMNSNLIYPRTRFFKENKIKLKQSHLINQVHSKDNFLLKFRKDDNKKIRQNFTFRRRNLKQNILNQINKFIRDIEQQNFSNKKQVKLYNNQINDLQSQFRVFHRRFRKQTIINQKDMQNFKKIAYELQIKATQQKEIRSQKIK